MSGVDTSGFYKAQDGELYHGPNWVVNADYTLHRDLDADLGFEVDGWMFYPDEAAAREALGLPPAPPPAGGEEEAPPWAP